MLNFDEIAPATAVHLAVVLLVLGAPAPLNAQDDLGAKAITYRRSR